MDRFDVRSATDARFYQLRYARAVVLLNYGFSPIVHQKLDKRKDGSIKKDGDTPRLRWTTRKKNWRKKTE